jgi:protein-L-isoaspartate O-methyltransferase
VLGIKDSSFYIASKSYVYDTLSANVSSAHVSQKLNRFNPRILRSIETHPGRRFLEFGAGVGLMCEIAANLGKQVYYLELPGMVFDFAQWRFKKHGLDITAIQAKPDTIYLPGQYDIIYTDAVVSHLPTCLQIRATESMANALLQGGLLIFLVDLSGPTVDNPMLFSIDIIDLHKRLSALGLRCQEGYNSFCSIWRRP